jgi:hypothetical protein
VSAGLTLAKPLPFVARFDIVIFAVGFIYATGYATLVLAPAYEEAVDELHDMGRLGQQLIDLLQDSNARLKQRGQMQDEHISHMRDIAAALLKTTNDAQQIAQELLDRIDDSEQRAANLKIGGRRGRPAGSTKWSAAKIEQEMKNLQHYIEKGGTFEGFARNRGISERALRGYRDRWIQKQKGCD